MPDMTPLAVVTPDPNSPTPQVTPMIPGVDSAATCPASTDGTKSS